VLHDTEQKGSHVAMNANSRLSAAKSDKCEEDSEERRVELERRQFSYSAYIPERRSGRKRRQKPETSCSPRTSDDEDGGE
jgi:hypothetical protein